MKVFGYTADEIARVLNIAAAAVNTSWSRIRARILHECAGDDRR